MVNIIAMKAALIKGNYFVCETCSMNKQSECQIEMLFLDKLFETKINSFP